MSFRSRQTRQCGTADYESPPYVPFACKTLSMLRNYTRYGYGLVDPHVVGDPQKGTNGSASIAGLSNRCTSLAATMDFLQKALSSLSSECRSVVSWLHSMYWILSSSHSKHQSQSCAILDFLRSDFLPFLSLIQLLSFSASFSSCVDSFAMTSSNLPSCVPVLSDFSGEASYFYDPTSTGNLAPVVKWSSGMPFLFWSNGLSAYKHRVSFSRNNHSHGFPHYAGWSRNSMRRFKYWYGGEHWLVSFCWIWCPILCWNRIQVRQSVWTIPVQGHDCWLICILFHLDSWR